jgi:hypothetical protein
MYLYKGVFINKLHLFTYLFIYLFLGGGGLRVARGRCGLASVEY